MDAQLKKLVMTLAVTLILLGYSLANMQTASSSNNGVEIDLFTQKEPYSGRGSNVPSDAFGPGELVILYALVIENWIPRQNLLLTFYVKSPDGSSFSLTDETNASGIATINFTIPESFTNQTRFFGEWFMLASVLIGGNIFQDTLTFKVNWIVKLVLTRTLDENLTYRADFGIGGFVGVEIALRNIAMQMKDTTVAIVVQDELYTPIADFEIHDLKVQPNEKLVFIYCRLQIPKEAHIGKATIFVSAFTAPLNQSGTPYCPTIRADFFILPSKPLMNIHFHDAAVIDVVPSAMSVKSGQSLILDVMVRNEGTEVESFNSSVYFDDMLVGTLEAMALEPYLHANLNFTVDTSAIDLGDYNVTVSIPFLVNEADLTDNSFIVGVITIRPEVEQYYLTVTTDPPSIPVSGEGWYDENTNVTLTAPQYAPASTGVRYMFSYWDVDEAWRPGNPITVTMDANHTATAHYVLQYYLTVVSPFGEPSGEGWYDSGSTAYASLGSDAVYYGNGTRSLFFMWSGDASGMNYAESSPIVMDGPKTATANWKVQYEVAFGQSGLDSSASGSVMTIDSVSKTFTELFYSVWVDAGGIAAYSYSNVSSSVVGKRFVLVEVDGPLSPIVVTGPVTVTGNYKVQYYLTVRTDPFGITSILGEGWYDRGENVTLAASSVVGYDFEYWDIDGTAHDIGVSVLMVHMNNPHIATIHYILSKEGWTILDWIFWVTLLLLTVTVFVLIAWIYRRRKRNREAEEAFHSGWTAWFNRRDLLNKTSKT